MPFLGVNRKQRSTSNPLHDTAETLVGVLEKHGLEMYCFSRECILFNVNPMTRAWSAPQQCIIDCMYVYTVYIYIYKEKCIRTIHSHIYQEPTYKGWLLVDCFFPPCIWELSSQNRALDVRCYKSCSLALSLRMDCSEYPELLLHAHPQLISGAVLTRSPKKPTQAWALTRRCALWALDLFCV